MELSKQDTTAIKGIAICLMLWHHVFQDTTNYGGLGVHLGAVDLFLLLSGYGLAKQYANIDKPYLKNTAMFLVIRYLKFFLSYWFCFVVVVLVGNLAGYTFQDAYPASLNVMKCFLFDILGYSGWNSYLKTWWFNKMILQLYFVFPLLYMIARNKFTAIVGLLFVFFLHLNAMKMPGNVFSIVEGGFPAFYIGIVLAKHQFSFNGEKCRRWWLFVASLLTVGLLYYVVLNCGLSVYVCIFVRALLAVSIVVSFSLFPLKKNKVFPIIGKYSTIIYLTHALWLKLMPSVIYAPRYPILIFLWFLALSLAGAVLIGYLQKLVRYDKLQGFVLGKVNRIL